MKDAYLKHLNSTAVLVSFDYTHTNTQKRNILYLKTKEKNHMTLKKDL